METANGNSINLALGTGRPGQFGVPAGSLTRYGAILPVDGVLIPEEKASGQINPSGFLRKGVPGKKEGMISWKHPLTAAHLLEYFLHILGSCVKTTLAAGIYQYVFTPLSPTDTDRISTHFWGIFDKPPVELAVLYAIMFGGLELDIKDNAEIPVALKGIVGHGTLLSPATPAGGNTGTYTKGPYVRGLIDDPTAGKLYAYITDDAPALKFKLLQTTTVPTGGEWTAATTEFTVTYDDDGNATWQYAQSSLTGLDLGVLAENKDPLEIIFPGTATDHLDTVVADVFIIEMPGDWVAPATSELASVPRFTSAHWLTRFRNVGDPTWLEKPVNDGKIGIDWPIEADRGNLSRYLFNILRPGQLEPTIELNNSFVDRFFADGLDRHQRIESQQLFEGRQLSASYRESILFDYPSVAIKESKRGADKEGKIVQKLKLVGETNDGGDPPVEITVISDRNWTVPTL